jgi:ribosomal protein S27E
MTTPQHCPGFEQFKGLQSFTCKCPECGKEKEVFSDEFNKQHSCAQCGKPIDFSKCSLDAGGGKSDPR